MVRIFAAATTLVLTLALPFAGTPASAATAEVSFKVTMGQITVAADGEPEEAVLWGMPARAAQAPQPLDVAFTIDFTDVAGFAEFEFLGLFTKPGPDDDFGSSAAPEPCLTQDTVITCPPQHIWPEVGDLTAMGWFAVSSTSSAVPGDSGQVHVSTRVNGGQPVTTDGLVRIGEPVNLAGVGSEKLSVAPGATVTTSPQVRNTGTTAINGAILLLDVAPGLVSGSFRNCVVSVVFICHFTTVLEPGGTYRVSTPMPLRVPRDAAAGSENNHGGLWATVATFEDWTATFDEIDAGTPGTGPALTLEPVVGVDSVPQIDTEPFDDQAEIALAVSGRTRPDVSAVGATLTGAVGDTVTTEIGLRNLGPGTLHPELFPNNQLPVEVTVPGNVEVIEFDSRCFAAYDGVYVCSPSETALSSGGRSLFAFTFKVTKARGQFGTVVVNSDDWQDEDSVEGARNSANDSAILTVTMSDGAGAGTALPITGPGVALGVLLLVAGAAGLLLAGRRRTRFRI